MNPSIIIQARMRSERLPGKILMPLCDSTILGWVIDRCKQSLSIKDIIVATSDTPADDKIVEYLKEYDVRVFRGSENDVLLRYVGAAEEYGIRDIVRITADCPLIDPNIIDEVVELYLSEPCDYAFIEGYPRGTGDAEVVNLEALHRTVKLILEDRDRYHEHVTSYIRKNQFKAIIKSPPKNLTLPDARVCVDTIEDYAIVWPIADHFSPRKNFTTEEIIKYLVDNPLIRYTNINVEQKDF